MLLSFNALQYALYHNKNRLVKPELYTRSSDTNTSNSTPNGDNSNQDVSLVSAVIILVIEIIFLFYAIQMALHYHSNTKELVLHLLLAVFFTTPYVLLNAVFNTDIYKSFISQNV